MNSKNLLNWIGKFSLSVLLSFSPAECLTGNEISFPSSFSFYCTVGDKSIKLIGKNVKHDRNCLACRSSSSPYFGELKGKSFNIIFLWFSNVILELFSKWNDFSLFFLINIQWELFFSLKLHWIELFYIVLNCLVIEPKIHW